MIYNKSELLCQTCNSLFDNENHKKGWCCDIRWLIALIISLTLFFTGCETKSLNVKETVSGQCEELLECFSKNDAEGIKELFCTAVSDSINFDNELLEATEFFDGEVTSYDIKGIGSDEKKEHGKTEVIHVSPKIWDIETSTGKSYRLSYYAYIVNSDKPEYVGISEIQIKSDDGKEFTLGDYSLVSPK